MNLNISYKSHCDSKIQNIHNSFKLLLTISFELLKKKNTVECYINVLWSSFLNIFYLVEIHILCQLKK